jgi:GMP synthase-like glutamine amidotransferase
VREDSRAAVRIGLLECDHVDERYRPLSGDYRDMFAALLAAFGDIALVNYDVVNGQLPADPRECDGWLATGSRKSAYDDDEWIHRTAGFVRAVAATAVPFVGICFGHQLLAQALGGTVERADSGWGAGILQLEVVRDEPWMQPTMRDARLHFMHQDQVVKLPDDAEVQCSAEHCEVAMFTVGDTMLGIQAHPEFTSAYAEALLTDRTERIGGDKAASALLSLTQPTDEAIVAQWITRFLAQAQPQERR